MSERTSASDSIFTSDLKKNDMMSFCIFGDDSEKKKEVRKEEEYQKEEGQLEVGSNEAAQVSRW